MKKLLGIFGWAWGMCFIVFFISTLVRMQGGVLPVWLEQYRASFQGALEYFLSSSLFGIVFLVVWVAISFQLSRESGWKILSGIFSSDSVKFDEPDDWFTTSGKFGKIRHNGILKVGGNNTGLVFKVLFPFRIGHPNLFINWQEIESITIQKGQSSSQKRGLLSKLVTLVPSLYYANFKLKKFPNQFILIRWQNGLKEIIPPNLVININDF